MWQRDPLSVKQEDSEHTVLGWTGWLVEKRKWQTERTANISAQFYCKKKEKKNRIGETTLNSVFLGWIKVAELVELLWRLHGFPTLHFVSLCSWNLQIRQEEREAANEQTAPPLTCKTVTRAPSSAAHSARRKSKYIHAKSVKLMFRVLYVTGTSLF